MFPKAWYPNATPENLEKWQIPACASCNSRYGKIENDLLGRVALTLDVKNPASTGLAEKALRALNRCCPERRRCRGTRGPSQENPGRHVQGRED
jgi:hypothetical protein